jgi:predicted nicotinamide N-methyase
MTQDHTASQPQSRTDAIRAILLRAWHPTGAGEEYRNIEEYDGYAGDIDRLLATEDMTLQALSAHLRTVAVDRMTPNGGLLDERCAHAATQIFALRPAGRAKRAADDFGEFAAKVKKAKAFITANLPIAAVPLVPELRLHKAGPQSGLWRLAERDDDFGSPYWAHHWGGGLALARYVLDHPQAVSGRRIIDLGAGSGIVGIAAAKAGAAEVVAADVDPYAVAATAVNARANRIAAPRLFIGDITTGEPPAADLICVGDLFYHAALADRVTAFLDRCLERGIEVIVGDPWRAHLPCERLHVLAEYSVPDFGDSGGRMTAAAVFAFQSEAA